MLRDHAVGSVSPSTGRLLDGAGSQRAPACRRHEECSASPGFICRPGVSSCCAAYTYILHKLAVLRKEILLPRPPSRTSRADTRIAVAMEQTTHRTSTGYNGPFCWFVFCLVSPFAWLTARPEAGGRAGVCLWMEMPAHLSFKCADNGRRSDLSHRQSFAELP